MKIGTTIKKTNRSVNRTYLYRVEKVQIIKLGSGKNLEFYWGLRVHKNGSVDARGNGGGGILKVICDDKALAKGRNFEVVK